jgi:hypothetical protein
MITGIATKQVGMTRNGSFVTARVTRRNPVKNADKYAIGQHTWYFIFDLSLERNEVLTRLSST